MNRAKLILPRIAILIAFALAFCIVPSYADSVSGTLFYTTFLGGTNVHSVDFNFNGSTLTYSNNIGIASTRGADGILFAPDGNLLVAGQGNNLTEVNTSGGFVKAVAPEGGSFHLALTPGGGSALVYNLNNGGCGSNCISAVQLVGGGLSANGNVYTVSCSAATPNCSLDVRGVIFDPVNSKWYYDTAPDGGTGDVGTVVFNDATHTAVLTKIGGGYFAHGISFDPFSGDLIVNSADVIQQLDANGTILSSITVPGEQFDQAAEDGHGHLFAASNFGDLEFVDYDATGLIGAAGNFRSDHFIAFNLDDIAPLSGLGGNTTPEPSTLLLLGSGLLALAGAARRKLNL
jgi:hypothetical protein